MAGKTFKAFLSHQPDTNPPAKVQLLANALKTIQQLTTPSNKGIDLVEFALTFDSIVANQPGSVELFTMPNLTNPATITQYVAEDITKASHPLGEPSLIDITSTSKSGFNCLSEPAAPSTPHLLHWELVSPVSGVYLAFEGDQEMALAISNQYRVRCKFNADVGAAGHTAWVE